jgi:glutamyl-tRNA synthetase
VSRKSTKAPSLTSLHLIQPTLSRPIHSPWLRVLSAAAVEVASSATATPAPRTGPPRVRFAPSPTGNLHVGGARTALFNWLYAKKTGGSLILRVEDTDAARSTRESEAAVLRDLEWLGINWDEGPDVGGACGPYRQSERTALYKGLVDRLVAEGKAYPCFCTDEEITAMKADAEAKSLPPIYRGKWATAPKEEVEAALAAGTPHCYRFRVPPDEEVIIADQVRGEVRFHTSAVGDFVVLRSNGLPVYNFCVAVDDALMGVTHVIRAEEHLPNTLRQVLIYRALGWDTPAFGHVSLILAPDKSKLSKRHGATSVGEFKEQGFLPAAMVNYLALLGWNDGTEQEIYTADELASAFSLDRITKSPAVFDKTKLAWMNGQHLRALPDDQLVAQVAVVWRASGLLKSEPESPFVKAAAAIVKTSLELLGDADVELRKILAYPLAESVADPKAEAILEDDFGQVARAVLAAHASGDLASAVAGGGEGFKAWVKAVGKDQARKGKRLFMPLRLALTGSLQGADVGEQLEVLAAEGGDVADAGAYVPLDARMAQLKAWLEESK